MKRTLHEICSTDKCIELVEVRKFDYKEHYCEKCEKKRLKKLQRT